MKQSVKYVLTGLLLFLQVSLFGQNVVDLRLNELLITNTEDYQDDFGVHSSWFEIFNTGYGTVNIGGCYLSNDPDDLKNIPFPEAMCLHRSNPGSIFFSGLTISHSGVLSM